MEEGRRNRLEAKLKEMLKQLEQAEVKEKEPTTLSAACHAIRRREGEKDKRLSV